MSYSNSSEEVHPAWKLSSDLPVSFLIEPSDILQL